MKEKQMQIEKDELFSILHNTINGGNFDDLNDAVYRIYDVAGYRKQSEGAWMTYHCVSGEPSARGRCIQYKTYTCDVCGKSNGRKKSNFCPNCGARMKGGDR